MKRRGFLRGLFGAVVNAAPVRLVTVLGGDRVKNFDGFTPICRYWPRVDYLDGEIGCLVRGGEVIRRYVYK